MKLASSQPLVRRSLVLVGLFVELIFLRSASAATFEDGLQLFLPLSQDLADHSANQHPINPNIYGVAYASTDALNDLNAALNRNGGNNASRYNWLQNADNRAQDWYFENIGDMSSVAGERGDTSIGNAKAANAQPMLTIPLLEWVAKLGNNPRQARQLFDCQIPSADRERLAVVARSLCVSAC